MGKRLILICALVFAVAFCAAAYAEVQSVKVGGDLTFMGIGRKLDPAGSETNKEKSFASIARIQLDADLTDNVVTTVRLLNERYWDTEAAETTITTTADDTEIQLDLAYVTLKEFMDFPLTLAIGRQEIHLGSEMIMGDVDTNNAAATNSAFSTRDPDLSARKSFDAIRATLDYNPLTVDLIVAKLDENTIGENDDDDLYAAYASYNVGDKYDSVVDMYYFLRREAKGQFDDTTGAAGISTGYKTRTVNVLGSRILTHPIENLTYSLEGAYQFGKWHNGVAAGASNLTPSANLKAWALETGATYVWKDANYTPALTMLYAYFSGDADDATFTDNDRYRMWQPLFENQSFGHISNALFGQQNAHIAGGKLSVAPMEDLTLSGEYYAFWWAKAYNGKIAGVSDSIAGSATTSNTIYLTNDNFAAQEVDLKATYNYTEDVELSLLGGVLVPGDSFDESSDSTIGEVIASMKVTF